MRKVLIRVLIALAIVASVAACGSDDDGETADTEAAAPATTAASAPATTMAPADEAPTELDVAMILLGTKEEGWYATFIDSVNRVAESQPHGLTITLDTFEEIAYADGERVIRDLAQQGKYEMIVAHSTYVDGVQAVQGDYPDMLFAYSGSGNDDHVGGSNAYWIDVFIHEPAYLAGIIAGMMTETNKLSAVAAFPFPNVNGPLNAFFDGAKSVNPDVEIAGVTYIESWFDPATGANAAAAQIDAGADIVYAERFGPFAAAEEAGNVRAIGHFTDQLGLSDVVLTSAVAQWDAAFNDLVDAWYAYHTEGTAYNAPGERIVYQSMRDGGSSLGAISDAVPADVVAAVEEAQEAILSGELTIPLVLDSPS